jgi:hypothetical protein
MPLPALFHALQHLPLLAHFNSRSWSGSCFHLMSNVAWLLVQTVTRGVCERRRTWPCAETPRMTVVRSQ